MQTKMKEAAIALVIFIVVLQPFLIGLNKETFHVDESLHTSRGIRSIGLILRGDFRPEAWWFDHGFITPANVIIGIGPWLIGVRSGIWWIDEIPPDHVLVSARVVVALLGALTCVVLFYLGKAVGGIRTGLFASLLLAFNPLWLMSSRRAMRDTPAAFFSVISVFLFYYGIKSKQFNRKSILLIALSGLTTGLAIGSKLPMGVTLITIAAFLLLIIINEYQINRKKRLSLRSRKKLLYICCTLFIFMTLNLLAYIASIPYFWPDPYRYILVMFKTGATESVKSMFRVPGDKLAAAIGITNYVLWPIYWPTPLRHFPTCLTWYNGGWYSLPCYSTLPATSFFFAGIARLALKGAKKKYSQIEMLTSMWFVIALIGLSWWIPIFRPRYVLPLIPSIILIEAIGLSYFLQGMSRKMGYLFAGVTLATHIGSTLIGFPEYFLFRLQDLFVNNISLILTTAFIFSMFCITIPRIRSILIARKHIKYVGSEKHKKN